MKTLVGGVALALLVGCATSPQATMPRRPNVVVFLVDDLGWQDSSEPFHRERTPWNDRYRTPNLERLCRAGTKFTQAYAHPVCTPSRASLLTGMAAATHRATHWTLRQDTPTDPQRHGLLRPEWNLHGLSSEATTPRAFHAPTLPQRLRTVGYRSILVGKAHFGAIGTPGADPRQLGFDENVAGHAAGAPSSYLAKNGFLRNDKDTVWKVPGLERHHGSDRFLTDVLTDEAIAAAARARADGAPFFLYLAHYAVHTPLDADARFVQRYLDAGLPEAEARYAALVEGMDHSLGRLLDWLEAQGIADDTLVVFASDNGGLSANSRGGEPHRHNSPLRSGKGSLYEGGLRIPFVASWPGHVPANATSPQPVQLEDLLPTVCGLLGLDAGAVDGTSLAAAWTGGPAAPHPLFFHHPHYWGSQGPGIEPGSAVRDGDWKLVWFYRDARAELYDLAHDLGETQDLAAARPEVTARLRALLRAHLQAKNAQVPSRADGTPCALP